MENTVRRLWTKDELILAFSLYLKLPFGKMHSGNTDVIYLANLLQRTPSSIALRLTNFASIDPFHQARGVAGMSGGRAQVEPIWKEFIDNKEQLFFESEKILASKEATTIEQKYSDLLTDIKQLKGEEKTRLVKTRVNQNVFRQIILSNYQSKCALSSIDIPELLIASHIMPWSVNDEHRLNPENGICLSALYDKAFDKGFFTLDNEYRVQIGRSLRDNRAKDYYKSYFQHLEDKKISLPDRFLPRADFLGYHRASVFKN